MNNNGWGLRVELAFLLLFLVCLLISTIGLHKLGLLGNDNGSYDNNSYINDNVNYDYSSLETKVTNAASEYYKKEYNSTSEDTIIVNVARLKNSGYLDSIRNASGRECNGYAMILQSGNIVSYIRCGMYKTVGYNSEYE